MSANNKTQRISVNCEGGISSETILRNVICNGCGMALADHSVAQHLDTKFMAEFHKCDRRLKRLPTIAELLARHQDIMIMRSHDNTNADIAEFEMKYPKWAAAFAGGGEYTAGVIDGIIATLKLVGGKQKKVKQEAYDKFLKEIM